MKKFRTIFLLFFAAAFFSCEDGTNAGGADSSYSKQIFDLINQYRKSSGLKELSWSGEIFLQCQNHSSDMASGSVAFGHDGFDKRCEKLKPWYSAAENVAMNYSTDPKDVVKQWLDSSGHKKNIESDTNLSALSAVKSSSGAWYYTQIFIKR